MIVLDVNMTWLTQRRSLGHCSLINQYNGTCTSSQITIEDDRDLQENSFELSIVKIKVAKKTINIGYKSSDVAFTLWPFIQSDNTS